MQVPAIRYRRAKRRYDSSPPEWEYPSNAKVKKLNTQGNICLHSRRYFVSEALSGEWVQYEEFDHKILIRFRHTDVREIDLRTGRSQPIVRCQPS